MQAEEHNKEAGDLESGRLSCEGDWSWEWDDAHPSARSLNVVSSLSHTKALTHTQCTSLIRSVPFISALCYVTTGLTSRDISLSFRAS